MGFFGFLRAGSLQCFDPDTHLTPRHVSVDSRVRPSLISFQIKQSKTSVSSRDSDLHGLDGQRPLPSGGSAVLPCKAWVPPWPAVPV